jgi:hypothetical protein
MSIRNVLPLLILPLLLATSPGAAQDQEQLLVVFLDDSNMRTATILDTGPDGLTSLESIFVNLGAETMRVSPNEPLPPEADVIVMVRPYDRISQVQAFRIWLQIERGGNLLLALDPSGHIRGSTDDRNGPLQRILFADYGARFLDGILVEPSFTQTSLRTLQRSLSRLQPYPNLHPLTEPLLDYDLPVVVWGARPLEVEPLGVDSRAETLLYAEPLFVERHGAVFLDFNAAPLQLDLDQDTLGRMLIGAVGENSRTDTRVALLGDSELLQNGYGLARYAGSDVPVNVANVVLTERLAAWLLELPEEDWPPLPAGFTWIALDGDGSDWDPTMIPAADATPDPLEAALNLKQARAFLNNDFLYVLAEMEGVPAANLEISLGFDVNQDGAADVQIISAPERVFFQGFGGASEFPIPDGQMVIGSDIELRLPRRAIIANAPLVNICLRIAGIDGPLDCLDQAPMTATLDEADPVTLRYEPELLATVAVQGGAALRTGPSLGYAEQATIPNRRVFAAIGRTQDEQWIQVQDARYVGWIGAGSLRPAGDFTDLPVIEIQQ